MCSSVDDNLVREITAHRDITFDYVSISQNPADLATRGVLTDKLVVSWPIVVNRSSITIVLMEVNKI